MAPRAPEYKPHWFPKSDVLGTVYLWCGPKGWGTWSQGLECLMWDTNTCSLGRSAGPLRPLPVVCHCVRGGAFGKTMIPPLLPTWVWSFYPLLWRELLSQFSVDSIPYVAADLVCPCEEVHSGSSCITILDHPSIFLSFLKGIFVDVRSFIDSSFLLILEHVTHCILASNISGEKLAFKLIDASWFVRSCFPFAAFKFFSLSLIFSIFPITCLGMALFVSYYLGFILCYPT